MATKLIAAPAYLGSSVADIYTPPNAAVDVVITQIHLCNVTTGSVSATLYLGATGGSAAGTEILKGKAIAANDVYDAYFSPGLRLTSTQFLTGLASAATSVTITVLGSYQAA